MQVPLPLLQVEDLLPAACGQPCHFAGICSAVSSVGRRIALRLLTCPACNAQQAVLPGVKRCAEGLFYIHGRKDMTVRC